MPPLRDDGFIAFYHLNFFVLGITLVSLEAYFLLLGVFDFASSSFCATHFASSAHQGELSQAQAYTLMHHKLEQTLAFRQQESF